MPNRVGAEIINECSSNAAENFRRSNRAQIFGTSKLLSLRLAYGEGFSILISVLLCVVADYFGPLFVFTFHSKAFKKINW